MTTKLEIRNDTEDEVQLYLTLGATPGCVQDVDSITVISYMNSLTITKLYPLMGYIMMPAKTTAELIAPAGMGFNGNISAATPPLNCPTPEFPEGVNLAEFIINNGFQVNGQETVDISCVAGANAYFEFELSADDWSTNGGAIIPVKHMHNDTRYRNTGLIGVFPYGCDNCTSSDNPPDCVGKQPQNANTLPICNVQRASGSNQGGTVHIVFKGMTPVPA